MRPRAALLLSLAPLFWAGNALVGRMVYPLISPMTLNFLRWVTGRPAASAHGALGR
jgi:hypothetical protein